MHRFRPQRARLRAVLLGLAAALAIATSLTTVAAGGAVARADTASAVVVSQVYGGGGNSGATFANDFVELLNRGSTAVDLSTWSLQYATASGTTWQATPLTGSIAPGRYYLVQFASTAAVGAALPTPDLADTTNLAASGGKVALVRDAAPLTCGATVGSCSAAPLVADLVGYGSATDYEGAAAAPALSSTTAAVRASAGCDDTDANGADFTAALPVPHNSASPKVACSGVVAGGGGTSGAASVNVTVQSSLSITLDKPTLSFGQAAPGQTPAPLAEHVTVVSNDAAGYTLTVHRSVFTPGDLPLGLSAVAPAGGQLASGLSALVALPIAPAADLLVGTRSAATAAAGDLWPISIGFTAPLPAVAAGLHTATVTFTVIGR